MITFPINASLAGSFDSIISRGSFMTGVDFFETTLLEDLSTDGDAIYIPEEDLSRLPSEYPFPLTIGSTGQEEICLCTGPYYVNNVLTMGLKVDRLYFDPAGDRVQTRVKGDRVICAPTISYFKELYAFVQVLSAEHAGMLGASMLVLANGNLSNRVLNWSGNGASFAFSASGFQATLNRGVGICNDRLVSIIRDTEFNFLVQYAQYLPLMNHYRSVLCYVDEFNKGNFLFSDVGDSGQIPIVPEIPSGINALPIASFAFSFNQGISNITDLRQW